MDTGFLKVCGGSDIDDRVGGELQGMGACKV